ncbi:hypothetical protein TNCV_1045461 [Trichonephila clavipes]|nr:hypothetical protein TNCV_1045461 [Trichonephila clavipes]
MKSRRVGGHPSDDIMSENSPCTTLVSFWLFKLVQSLVNAFSLYFRNAFGPTEVQFLIKNVPLVLFLIDFNALFSKTQRCFATCTNSAPDHGRLLILVKFNNCRSTWGIHTPDSIVLGVRNLLNRKELLISEKK